MDETIVSFDIGWQPKIVIGRLDPQTRRAPDISLDCLNAYENGVSRRHALLLWRNQGLCILDLDSANGTAVNGHKLLAHQAHGLKHGDMVELGQVRLQLRFNPSNNYPPVFTATVPYKSALSGSAVS